MTERLFDFDGRILSFEAKVISCEERNGSYEILLDRSAFAPEGGGQISDIGFLGDSEVTDVRRVGDELFHICTSPLPVGALTKGEVDRARRMRHIRSHSGEHIVSGLFHSEYGMTNVGFHIGHEAVTLDLDGTVGLTMLRHIEAEANEIICRNLPIRIYYPTAEELAKTEYRSKKELTGDVRLVEIPGVDLCACCAPHVASTGEIGCLRLLDCIRYKGGSRITMKAGPEAIEESNREHDRLSEVGTFLSLPFEAIPAGVKKLSDELSAERYTAEAIRRELIAARLAALGDGRRAVFFEKNFGIPSLRMLADGAAEKGASFVAAFSGSDSGGYAFVLIENGDYAGTVARMRETFEVRGGGKCPLFSGTVKAGEEALRSFFGA